MTKNCIQQKRQGTERIKGRSSETEQKREGTLRTLATKK